MRIFADTYHSMEGGKRFKFHQALTGCEEVIQKYMVSPDGVYYRVVHDPFDNIDELPNPVRKWSNMSSDEVALSMASIPKDDLQQQWDNVKNYSPSFNISADLLINFMQTMYGKRKTDTQKQRFIANMGDTIVPVYLGKEDGMIQATPESTVNPGHVVFQPYGDFNMDEHIDWNKKIKWLHQKADDNEKI